MYICLCHAVTERQIKQAVSDGVCSLRQVQLCLRVGTNCGKCIPAAREVVDAALDAARLDSSTPLRQQPELMLVSSR